MKESKLGVCIVGAGRAGMIHARNFSSRVQDTVVVTIVDPQEEIAAKSAASLGVERHYRELQNAIENESIDAVVVATPTILHREIVLAAAGAGKHIFCEKPMAMTAEDCDAMIDAADSANVALQIGFMRRFDEGFQTAKERIDQGEIGAVVLVKSLTRGPSTPQPWQYDIRDSNGALAEVNSHDVDTLRWLTQSEFDTVYAIAGNYRCPEVRADFPDFYDNVCLVASFENGMQGLIDGAVSVGYGYDCRVEVLGTEGVLFVGRMEDNSAVTCSIDRGIVRPFVRSWRNLFEKAYLQEDQEFVDAVRAGHSPKVTGLDGKAAVQVVNAGYRSIQEKRPIRLNG